MDGVAVQGPVPCARRRRQRGAAWAFAAVGRGRLGGQPRCMRSEGRAVPTASSARLRARGPATGAARCERGCSGSWSGSRSWSRSRLRLRSRSGTRSPSRAVRTCSRTPSPAGTQLPLVL